MIIALTLPVVKAVDLGAVLLYDLSDMSKKVYVAMSGGVDSSVAAALLKEQGYSVVGVFMKFWSPGAREQSPLPPHLASPQAGEEPEGTVPGYCLWKEERADAARVAAKLGISLLTWDFTAEYEEKVVNYMLKAYKSGITPNPDIMCNKEIKFGLFFDKAIKEGADYVATGHYARILIQDKCVRSDNDGILTSADNYRLPQDDSIKETSANSNLTIEPLDSTQGKQFNNCQLLQAVDKNKDQSYFLYTLEQRHLEKTLFPIGDYTKPEVREMAKKFGLSTAEKKDSQGVCFIGPLKMKSFLKNYIKPKRGKVALVGRRTSDVGRKSFDKRQTTNDKRTIGSHDGAYYYTIGQRHGIDLKDGGGPYYVIGKDIEKNEIYVGKEEDLYANEAIVTDIHWVAGCAKLPAKMGVKVRYRSETVPATISSVAGRQLSVDIKSDKRQTTNDLRINFSAPVRALAPGQAVVFYDGEKVLGGGIIE